MRESSKSGRATRFVLTLTACVALLLVFGALTVRYIFVDLPAEIAQRTAGRITETARAIADTVLSAFHVQPTVTIGHKTIVEQQTSVLQLVTLEKAITERQRIDSSWLGSTKTLEMEGDFVVRVGFDLTKPFVIEIDRSNPGLRVKLPPAKILSVEMRSVRFLRDEDGLLNKLTPNDREAALRELRNKVALAVRQEGLPQRARAIAEKQLADVLAKHGRPITFEPEGGK